MTKIGTNATNTTVNQKVDDNKKSNNVSAIQSIRNLFEFSKPPDSVVSSGDLPNLQVPLILIGVDDILQYELKFPLTDDDVESIEQIKTHGSLATVGHKGVETFRPEKRLSHQVLPISQGGRLHVDERSLTEQPAFQDMLDRIQSDLNITGKIEASLYKFLYYENGCFFEKHHDHERLKHQVGTLSLQLPSIFQGGDLRVWAPDSLPGDDPIVDATTITTKVLPRSALSNSSVMKYAAFHTDCNHEVKKLTGGHRCVLVFSLLSLPTSNIPTSPLSVMSSGLLLASYLKQFKQEYLNHKLDRLVIPLSHSYSRNSLGYNPSLSTVAALKGPDLDIITMVSTAVKDAEFEAFIYLINSTGPNVDNIDGGVVLADTECPPIELPVGLSENNKEKGFYLTDTYRIPILKKHIAIGSGEVLRIKSQGDDSNERTEFSSEKTTSSRSSEMAALHNKIATERLYKRAVVILWPVSHRENIMNSILHYDCKDKGEEVDSDDDAIEVGCYDHYDDDVIEDGCYDPAQTQDDALYNEEGDY